MERGSGDEHFPSFLPPTKARETSMSIFSIFNGNKKAMPSNEWLKDPQTPPFTPDLHFFERRPYTLFFEYSDLQDRMPKHQMVSPYFTTPAYTAERYGCLNHSEDPKAIAFDDHFKERPIRRQKIRGELYAIKLPAPILIDSYRQNGVQFERRRVKVLYPIVREPESHRERTREETVICSAFAWMYFGKPDYWSDQINWDASFYKGRRGSMFPESKVYTDLRAEFNNHYFFTLNDIINHTRDDRCFTHLHRNLSDDRKQSAA